MLCFILLFNFQLTLAQCLREAAFQDGPDYTLDGYATVTYLLDGTKNLSFDSTFSTPSGPDLNVYLSKSSTVSTPGGVLQTPNTIDLGLLKSPSGSQSYDLVGISPEVDLDSYDHVIIHCKQYNHYWGTGSFGTPSGADCASLSVVIREDESVKVYPTVVQDNQFFIQLEKKQKVIVNIYSVLGEILQESLILSEELSVIDTSFLDKGIYIVQLRFENKTRVQQIIIQ